MPVLSASIDEALQQFGTQIADELNRALRPSPGTPARLYEAMQYSLMAGGKRLRPMLVLLACEACGGEPLRAMPAACAIEMVHTYSLIHDDLPAMDNDDFRRGRPTNHVVFGEALAILAGDGLLTLAFEVLARDLTPAATAAACCADLARAAGMSGMVGGQVADLQAEGRATSTPQELEAIHHRKTGALLSAALTMGARIADADLPTIERLANYGRCLGLAFQITDDLLDVRGSQQATGKAVQKDAGRGKLTYPSLLGEEASVLRARCLIAEACGSLEPMGERGRRLEALAQFVLERDH
ncbi:MAG: polyprenyl synthetase family protein [Planctomycetaceae bacterium]|nr:polyprenyl synthetase family protein [Planctomycetaceae bacterium]